MNYMRQGRSDECLDTIVTIDHSLLPTVGKTSLYAVNPTLYKAFWNIGRLICNYILDSTFNNGTILHR